MASSPILGCIFIFAGNFAPRGYALCQGQIMSIQQNTALFSLLGTTYGGNGTTTFALPDLRGRAPIGTGTGPGLSPINEGQLGGANSASILIANMPSHSHALNASTKLAFDYQFIANPGYNADRGPANVFAGRYHWQF